MTPNKEIKALLLQKGVLAVCNHLLPNGKEHRGEWVIGSVAGESGKSMRVRLSGDKAGVWIDSNSKQAGDIITLWQEVQGVDFRTAMEEIRTYLGLPSEEEEKAASSDTWKRIQSQMGSGTHHDIEQVAALRKLPSAAGLEAAVENSHLFFGPVSDGPEGGPYVDHYSWIITDAKRLGGQARKMSGGKWHSGLKTKNLFGTTGRWPIGIADCPLPEIALVEGSGDFVAAYTAVAMLGLLDRIQPVAILGASQQMPEEALNLFAGKTVWVFPHADDSYAGLLAARKWCRRLMGVKATVIPFDFTPYPGVKDLNDFVSALTPAPTVESMEID